MSRYLLRQLLATGRHQSAASSCASRPFHSSAFRLGLFPQTKPKDDEAKPGVKTKDLVKVKEFFDGEFQSEKDGKHFVKTIENYQNIRKLKRFGYAEFVAAALPAMKQFGVEKDLESYKALMRIFQPGSCVPSSKLASGFYPHFIQQRTAVEILSQMEEYRIQPDKEMESDIIAAFSEYSHVWQKCARMTYWLTKFKNSNPFPLPEAIPDDALELAIIALKRMSIDPQAEVTVYQTSQLQNSTEDTWVCFAQSESQCQLIEALDPIKYRVSVDGPFNAWVDKYKVSYFVLFARDMTPKPPVDKVEAFLQEEHKKNDVSNIPLANFGHATKKDALDPYGKVHQQDDGTILAVAATGTSSQESLMAWVRMLERENPRLSAFPVIISNKENMQPSQPPKTYDSSGTDKSREF